jgi:hypothetical protein
MTMPSFSELLRLTSYFVLQNDCLGQTQAGFI